MDNKLISKTYYEQVSVEDEMPEKEGWYFIELNIGTKIIAWYVPKFKCFDDNDGNRYEDYEVKFWLKPLSGILISEIALLNLLFDAHIKGFACNTDRRNPKEDFDTFIKSKGLPSTNSKQQEP